MFLIDSHCHVDLLNYHSIHSGLEDVLEKSIKSNVKLLLSVSTSISNFNYVKNFIKDNKNILLSCGIHPLHLNKDKDEIEHLKTFSQNKDVIAIGETGLDYYYSIDNSISQQLSFRQHINIAIKHKKPLLIHTRHAINDTINILKEEKAEQCIGIIHSFTENLESARKLLDMGFYISFSGIITFKNSSHIRQIAKFIPIDRILLETDAPYLAPIPHRGKENQPAFLYDIALIVAKLKNIDIEVLSEYTTQNFIRLFHLESFASKLF
ncbi:YchF/TatD family DNA exonuclease [Buchnera aphidicola]|uniref:YchF/TatD family DNA exonuclease n=1 Tax=Buchnera aphidicola subsp. Melaphis rhois TaxID=118103 RepID=A0A4D6Y152_BUCMH|nr:YchF/TatD family DNA exonuclease [Buchnera aphidicola]QCI23342.1 YchF/TatD family DNA exonuclease [Buchnera aphidicola (Melaphis rhois)]